MTAFSIFIVGFWVIVFLGMIDDRLKRIADALEMKKREEK